MTRLPARPPASGAMASGRPVAVDGPVVSADRHDTADLDVATLHESLVDPVMASMNFLNEVSSRFPDAISFAAGRPLEDFFDTADIARQVDRFVEYLRIERSLPEDAVRRTLFQYGRTNGIIHDLVARHLEVDEGVRVSTDSVVVTVGAQEAMFLVLRALRASTRDVVLAVSPTYVGLTGAARLVECPIVPVHGGDAGIDLDDLAATINAVRADGRRPRALYVVPDVANPSGISLDLQTRQGLLAAAAEQDILILEDNAYGVFAGEQRLPTLKALDVARRVIRLGSFAKSVSPGARVGYVIADQRVHDSRHPDKLVLLADHLSAIKSMLTVNTSPIAQAVIGGALLAHGHSLVSANRRQIAIYQHKLAAVLEGLARRFPPAGVGGRPIVTWNSPTGGFFVTLTVPFPVDDKLLEWSARKHGVLWTPMSHFYADEGGRHQIRLAFSQLVPAQIDDGLDRLARFIHAAGRSTLPA